MAEREIGDESARATHRDEDAPTEPDQFFEEARSKRGPDAGMGKRDRDFTLKQVHLVRPDLRAEGGHRSSTVLADDLLDDILEVAQDDAAGHLDTFAIASLDVRDVGGLDDRFPRRIEFEDRGVAERRWRGAIGSHGGSLPDESSFRPALKHPCGPTPCPGRSQRRRVRPQRRPRRSRPSGARSHPERVDARLAMTTINLCVNR